MSQKLPLLPIIDHLRLQAQTLLDSCCIGDLDARSQVCSQRIPNPPEEQRARIDKLNAEFTRRLEEQQYRIRHHNEQIQREHEERQQRIREQNELLSRTRSESYDGKDLKPCLTPDAEEYTKLRQQPSEAIPPGRNYMGRVGLWLSQVGWEQQIAGEHAYGYGYNDPVTQVDPSGRMPKVYGDCKELANIQAGIQQARDAIKSCGGQTCINRLGLDYRNCINDWVEAQVMVKCGSQICVDYQSKHPDQCLFAYTKQGNWFVKCQITICTGGVGNQTCWPAGVTSVPQMIAYVLIHEAMHCCGMLDHARAGKDPNNPADDVARCVTGIPGHLPKYDINIE